MQTGRNKDECGRFRIPISNMKIFVEIYVEQAIFKSNDPSWFSVSLTLQGGQKGWHSRCLVMQDLT